MGNTNETAAALAGARGGKSYESNRSDQNYKSSSRAVQSAASNSYRDRIRLKPVGQQGRQFAPYAHEVQAKVDAGQSPNVVLYAGVDAWDRAERRREQRGLGSTLILPPDIDPVFLIWPPLPAVLVDWPGSGDFERKLSLGAALIRDYVRIVHIRHEPQWLRISAKAAA